MATHRRSTKSDRNGCASYLILGLIGFAAYVTDLLSKVAGLTFLQAGSILAGAGAALYLAFRFALHRDHERSHALVATFTDDRGPETLAGLAAQISPRCLLATNQAFDVALDYHNDIDVKSSRLITVHSLIGTRHRDRSLTVRYILAFCHLRQEPRTFRVDRIEAAHDPKTGELIPHIAAWLLLRSGINPRVRE